MIMIIVQLTMNLFSTKATIAKNTTPSAPNFESACISNAEQKIVSTISYHMLNQKFGATINGPIPPPLP